MEWWNSGSSTDDLYCFAAVTVTNTHVHFGASVTSLSVAVHTDIHMTTCECLVTVNCGNGVSSSPTLFKNDNSFMLSTSVADTI